MRSSIVLSLMLVACGAPREPTAPLATTEPPATASPTAMTPPAATTKPTATPTATSTGNPAGKSSSALDAAACAQRAGPLDKGCHWTVVEYSPCRGVAPPPGADRHGTPRCVCNGCDDDGDCKASPGGKCESFFAVCSPSAKACVYPGQSCFDNGKLCKASVRHATTYSETRTCAPDGHGHAHCVHPASPPP